MRSYIALVAQVSPCVSFHVIHACALVFGCLSVLSSPVSLLLPPVLLPPLLDVHPGAWREFHGRSPVQLQLRKMVSLDYVTPDTVHTEGSRPKTFWQNVESVAASKNRGWSFLSETEYSWIDWKRGIIQSCLQFQDHRILLHHSRNSPCLAVPESEPLADFTVELFSFCCVESLSIFNCRALSASTQQILRYFSNSLAIPGTIFLKRSASHLQFVT